MTERPHDTGSVIASNFTKIQNFIREKNIKSSDCEYHTQRLIESGKGKIRVLALKSDKIARTEYICPFCRNYGYNEIPWKRPFSTICDHCKKKISVPKMKQQFKRELKKAQKGEN